MKVHFCSQICFAYLVTSSFLSYVSGVVFRHTSRLRDHENLGKRVEGGEIAEKGRYPYVATIYEQNETDNGRENSGYGTLIAPSWVISDSTLFSGLTDMSNLYVALNNYKKLTVDDKEDDFISIKVKRCIKMTSPNTSTDDENFTYSVTLLELEEATATPHISFIAEEKTSTETIVTAIGWPDPDKFYFDSILGLDSDTSEIFESEDEEIQIQYLEDLEEFYSNALLREVNLETMSDDQCVDNINEFYMELGLDQFTDDQLLDEIPLGLSCAHNKDKGLCWSDYGVPIIMKGSETDSDILVGVGYNGLCGYAVSVFYDIHLFREWISEITGITFPSPPTVTSDDDPDEGSDEVSDNDRDDDIGAVLATLLTFFCN